MPVDDLSSCVQGALSIVDIRPKRFGRVSVFGLGGCGLNIVKAIGPSARLTRIVMDTHASHLRIVREEDPSLDAVILVGKNTCKGLPCLGDSSKGYTAAKESFDGTKWFFSFNEVNIFVVGLGGWAGAGIAKYVLEKIEHDNHWEKDPYNKCNIVIAMSPLDKEMGLNEDLVGVQKKFATAVRWAFDDLKKLCGLMVVVDMGELHKREYGNVCFCQMPPEVNSWIVDFIARLSKLSNERIIERVDELKKKGKVVRISKSCELRERFCLK